MSEKFSHSGPGVVFLHGALGCPGDWECLAGDLALPASRCGYVDLYQRAALSGEEGLRDVLRRAMPGRKPGVLIGYSMGGRLALQQLLAFPDDYAGAVVVSAHPGLQDEVDEARRLRQDCEWARMVRLLPWMEVLAKWQELPVFAEARGPEHWRADLSAAWREGRVALEKQRTFVADAFERWSLGAQGDLRDGLSRLEKPLLWVTGSGDARFTNLADEAAALHPLAQHEVIAGVGHRVPWEAPDSFASVVQDFPGGMGNC